MSKIAKKTAEHSGHQEDDIVKVEYDLVHGLSPKLLIFYGCNHVPQSFVSRRIL